MQASELLILIAWFTGPATLAALAGATWLFRRRGLFSRKPGLAVAGCLATVVLVPALSIALVVGGVGSSPLDAQASGFKMPWFWQSFLAAAIVVGAAASLTNQRAANDV